MAGNKSAVPLVVSVNGGLSLAENHLEIRLGVATPSCVYPHLVFSAPPMGCCRTNLAETDACGAHGLSPPLFRPQRTASPQAG